MRFARLSLLALSILAAGCAPRATFPATPGTSSFEPWVAPIPELMAGGIEYAQRRHAPNEPLIFNLPPGVPQWVWKNVQGRLGEGARPVADGDVRYFSVTEVRVNGATGEVDVIYPAENDLFQSLTVGFRTEPFQSWRPIFERKWRIPTAPEPSNYGIWPVHESNDFPNQNPQPWEAREAEREYEGVIGGE